MSIADLTPSLRRPWPLALAAIPFVLIWTSAFPASKFALASAPPMLFLSLRFLTAGLLLLAWAASRGELARLRWRDLPVLALLGLLNHAAYLGLSWTGMDTASSGMATIIISANPLLVSLLAWRLLGEQLGRGQIIGLILGMLGVVWIVRHRLDAGVDDGRGVALLLAALTVLSFGTVLYKRLSVATPFTLGVALQLICAGLWLLPVAVLTEDVTALQVTPLFLGSFLWMVLVVSIGAYLLWFWLLERGSAGAVSAWLFLSPPTGLVMGAMLLGESVSPFDLVGILPIGLGIVLASRGRR